MNTELRKKEQNEFNKHFFKLMNNSVFVNTMENVKNHRDIKLTTTDNRRKRLVSEPDYHSHKRFSENLMAIEMKKTRVTMIKPLYLDMSILDISKTLMCKFWCDYIGPKYGDKKKLCYTDTDSFIINIKTEYFFEDISNDLEKWFDTSKYSKNDKRPLPTSKNKKVPRFFKDELGGKIITEVVALRPKAYAYLTDDGSDHKKTEGTKMCVIKQKLMFENYKDCLFNNKTVYRSQDRFRSYYHVMYTEDVNKIALSSNDDKRLETPARVRTYPYGTGEMMIEKLQ